jgi:formate hydrogenlyase subunit 3/multisubunit Na+/H+ antiporter MnhD subunit
LSPVSDPILLFLAIDAVALVLLGSFGTALRAGVRGVLAIVLSGLGMLLCLPSLLMGARTAALTLAVGPPGLSLHLVLDSLSMFFLVVVFLAGTAAAAFQQAAGEPKVDAEVRTIPLCLGGTVLALLAADGMTLAIGLTVACGAIGLRGANRYRQAALLVPLLVLVAVCLLAPVGFAPRFDAIRAVPVDPARAIAATALTVAAVAGLIWRRSDQRCWTRNALTAGVLIPFGCYLLLRMIADLAGTVTQIECGFVLLLGGGAIAVIEGWCAARHSDIDGSVLCLMRRQAGLAAAGIGLALIARAADLPAAASFALTASFLSVLGSGVAGLLTSLAAHAMGASAGTWRLSRLGGLVHAMGTSSAALTVGLLGLSALPPGLGFASLWLLFESILSAPRTGGLLFQLPLALSGAAVALSAALAAAASVRLLGTAVLGRPRTPQGAGAREGKPRARGILLVLAGLTLVAGLLPGLVTLALAEPAIRALSGAPPGARVGLSLLLPSISSPSYLALPVFALLALATAIVHQVPRWSRKEAKTAGFWSDGMEPPFGLPFGDPAAQSVGEGFLPALPALPRPGFAWPARWAMRRQLSSVAALWIVLAGFSVLLLVLAVVG